LSVGSAGSTAGGALGGGSGTEIGGAGGRSTVSMLIILALGESLGRSMGGDWVWSSDEDDSLEKDIPVTDNYIPTDNNSSPKHNHLTDDKNSEIVTNIESLGSPMTTEPQPDVSVVSNPINLVLRIRNAKKELNDIRFEFTVDKGLHIYHILTILSFGDQL